MMNRVTKRVNDDDGKSGGIEHPILFTDHSLYQVSFPNVRTEELIANMIAKHMLSQVDSEGHHYQVLNYISDHSVDGGELNRIDGFMRSFGGNLHAKKTTSGWKL